MERALMSPRTEPILKASAMARTVLLAIGSCAAAGMQWVAGVQSAEGTQLGGLQAALTGGLLTSAISILTNLHTSRLDREKQASPAMAADHGPTEHLLGLAGDALCALCQTCAAKAPAGTSERRALDYASTHVRDYWLDFTGDRPGDLSRAIGAPALPNPIAAQVALPDYAHVLSLSAWEVFARFLFAQDAAPAAPDPLPDYLGQFFHENFAAEFYGKAQQAAARDPIIYAALQLHLLGALHTEGQQHSRELQKIRELLQQHAFASVTNFDEQKKLVLSKRLGQLRSDVLEVQKTLDGLAAEVAQPILAGLRSELSELGERQRQVHNVARKSHHMIHRVLTIVVLIGLVEGGVLWQQRQANHGIRDIYAKLDAAKERDAPGSELLDEFRRRVEAAVFSAQLVGSDQLTAWVLTELARDRSLTVDALRQRILQAAAGARERIKLAGQLRRASESEAAKLRQIERDGYVELASAALAEQQPAAALSYYQQALALTSRTMEARKWANLEALVAICHWHLSSRVEGSAVSQHLRDAVGAFREALGVFTHEQYPQDRAMAQNDLANSLRDLAGLTFGEGGEDQGANLMSQAIQTLRSALEIFADEHLPQQWAMTQINLGAALKMQGTHTGGQEAANLLGQSVQASRAALGVINREGFPQYWVKAEINLGSTLREQAARTAGEDAAKLLREAVQAMRAALEVCTRERFPEDWALAQSNLGRALLAEGALAAGEKGAKLLAQSVQSFRAALEVRTREHLHLDWAFAQSNLGCALHQQATCTTGEEGVKLLDQAVQAFRAAMEVYTRERLPQDWAGTQANLASALVEQGTRTTGEDGVNLLSQGIQAYRTAMGFFTQERVPREWGWMQINLGSALQEQGARTSGEERAKLLGQAVQAQRAAVEVFTRLNCPEYRDLARGNLEKALRALGAKDDGTATAPH
jgi:tetratricopeptide (TPR) repeat protein